MPSYELALVLRQMSRPEIVSVLKRTAETILDRDCVIRKLENLGTRMLPYKISEHGVVHREGTYFTISFDAAPAKISDFMEEFGRDIDIVRRRIFKIEEPEEFQCTLHEEMLPPAYRKDVQEMIDIAKRKQKPKFKYNTGLDYYPFQK
ncbi:probable 28S ribosomal protein S6, mitochondrial [Anastrepha obliqua]|uniref:probable 28S ribosomal protein S6, mitochondrial n=1 Tax=Anastrepha ludens TaxID=28586 RepID=UPI0023AE9D2D|nr:probable 28S ribosomal protein S6, mitochondrial [Anastrepha ludens]XP_054733518.1 probable 28S ribosomal protein S6, mitochondrial [Anastrepha obliqua]